MSKTLYLLRGVPGSGKTTLAMSLKELYGRADGFAPLTVATDDYMMKDGEYAWDPERLYYAHSMCQKVVEAGMSGGEHTIIVHNTLTTEKELAPYLEMAEKHGYRVVSLVVENRHGNKSVHNVPDKTLDAMARRFVTKLI